MFRVDNDTSSRRDGCSIIYKIYFDGGMSPNQVIK